MRPYNEDAPYYVLIINNYIIHYLDKLIKIYERKGVYLIYLLFYSLDFNLIK